MASFDVDARLDSALGSSRGAKRPGKSSGGSSTSAPGRVYVGNMSWTTTWQGLKDHMSRVGTVTRADILTRRDGKSAGCGIVEYSDPHDAERAIAELTDTDLDGRDIFVREDREGGSRGPGGAAAAAVARPAAGAPSRGGASNTRVYVNNLSWDVDWRQLKDHFKTVGPVAHADVLTESGGRSKGCGIVEFTSAADAERAIRTMQDTELLGRRILVREDRDAPGSGRGAAPSSDGRAASSSSGVSVAGAAAAVASTGNPRVYVGNLSWDVEWQDLKDHFKSVGSVAHADIIKEPTGRSKGCGIVEFDSPEDAARAIRSMQDTVVKGRPIFVREDREAREARGAGSASRGPPRAAAGGFGGGSGGGRGGGARIRIDNLPADFQWQEVKDTLRQLGCSTSCRTEGRDGTGFATFDHAGDADAALRLSGAEVNGHIVTISMA